MKTTLSGEIELGYGETAVIPVPEGRLVLTIGGDQLLARIYLHPLSGGEPQELAAFARGSFDPSAMMTVALAALDAWR